MSDPLIRLLTPADLDDAVTLSSTAGWNQQREDWRMLQTLAPRGSFAAIGEGRIVGTSIGIDYGHFGWIAMMLVEPAYRGRGVGRRLLEAAMAAVPSDRPIRLDATPMGRPLYQAFGFEDESMLTRYVAPAAARRVPPHPGGLSTETLTEASLPAIVKHDGGIFGADRRAVLDWALHRAPDYARVTRSDAGLARYCFGRLGRRFDQVGPVVADDDEAARALVAAALAGAEDRAVAIDAFDARNGFTAWLRAIGFDAERPLFRMRRRGTHAPPVPGGEDPVPLVEFAILGPDFG